MSTPDIHYLTDRELDELLRLVTNPKHRVLILIMADAGLRVSECVALRYDNLDFRKQVLRVKSLKKRDKSALRDIPISERLYHALADYIATKKAGETNPEKWLFPNPTDPSKPIQRFAVNRMLERLRAENPAFRNLHPHALRHTFATRHLATGTRLESIKTMLGHARYDTTLIYTHIPIEQLRRDIDAVEQSRPKPLLQRWSNTLQQLVFGQPKKRQINLTSNSGDICIGRTKELQKLTDLYEKNCNVLLIGETGLGKSHLLRQLQSSFRSGVSSRHSEPGKLGTSKLGMSLSGEESIDPTVGADLSVCTSENNVGADLCVCPEKATPLGKKIIRIDDLQDVKSTLIWMLIWLYKNDKEHIKEMLHGDLTLDQVEKSVRRDSIPNLCRMLTSATVKHEYLLLIDSLDKITPRGVKALEQLKDHFIIIAATREVALPSVSFMWNFEVIKLEPLSRKESLELIHALSRDLEIEDYALFRNHIFEQSSGNPRVIHELVERYRKEPVINADTVRDIRHTAHLQEIDMSFVVMVVLGSMVMLRYLSYETGESSWRFIGGAALVLLLISRQFFRFTRRKASIT